MFAGLLVILGWIMVVIMVVIMVMIMVMIMAVIMVMVLIIVVSPVRKVRLRWPGIRCVRVLVD